MTRVTAVWSGFPGAPGYTNFFFEGPTAPGAAFDVVGRVGAFFEAIDELLPNGSR